jgi:hypothetical protein
MADHATTYNRGAMDIQEQVSTFNLVMGMTKWGSLFLAAFLLFLVLWFCTATGFLGAAATGVVVLALGILLLKDGKKAAH